VDLHEAAIKIPVFRRGFFYQLGNSVDYPSDIAYTQKSIGRKHQMPLAGEIDRTYSERLTAIGIELQESFKGTKITHRMKCLKCQHKWSATPLSKIQSNKKRKGNGCPNCNLDRQIAEKKELRAKNIKLLEDRGLEILSDWDGKRVADKHDTPIFVTVRNKVCGHTFTSVAKNLLSRGITCAVCGKEERTKNINAWSKANSEKWRETADLWLQYRSKVMSLTRQNYKAHKQEINPNNLPTGKAGTEGAYQLDHIVPIRYCFEHYIPAETCADWSNLQMLPWQENLSSKAHLKEGIPPIFAKYQLQRVLNKYWHGPVIQRIPEKQGTAQTSN